MRSSLIPVTVVSPSGSSTGAAFLVPARWDVVGLPEGFLRPLSEAPAALLKAWGVGTEREVRLVKGGYPPIGPDEHWITLHPHGKVDAEGGVHVLVKEHPDGTAHVIAGAKGSLNGTRLTRISAPDEWAKRAKARSEQRQAAAKLDRAEYERATPEQKTAIHERRQQVKQQQAAVKQQRVAAERALAQAVGLVTDGGEVDRKAIQEARRYVKGIQDEVTRKHNEEIAQRLGGVPTEAILMPEVDASGRGYRDAMRDLAQANGLDVAATDEQLRDAAVASGNASPDAAGTEEEQQDSANKRQEREQAVRRFVMERPKDAYAALIAHEKLLDAERRAKALRAEEAHLSTSGKVQSGAAEFVGTALSDADAENAAAEALSQRASTNAMRGLLDSVTDFEQEQGSIERHVLSARHAQLSALYSSVTGMPLPLDRRVSDTLGIDATAALTAAMLEREAGGSFDEAARQLAQRHIATQEQLARGAVDEAEKMLSLAESMGKDLPDVGEADVSGLMMLQVKNRERQDLLQKAGEKLGHAIGQVEAAGQLNASLRLGTDDTLRVGFGDTSMGKAGKQLQALGLATDDYTLSDDAGSTVARIRTDAAVEKLARRQDPQIARDYVDSQGIKAGEQDEDGWLPEGVVRRVSSDVKDAWTPAYEFRPDDDFHALSDAELKPRVAQYVGEFLGNYGIGAAPALYAMVTSAEFLGDHVDEGKREAFVAALNAVLPPEVAELPADIDADKLRARQKKGEALSGGEKAAADLLDTVDRAVAQYKEAQGVDTQSIQQGEHVYELIHRSLAAFPAAKVAFTPQGSFTAEDKQTVRDYFWQHVTDEDKPEGADAGVEDDDSLFAGKKPEKQESQIQFDARMKKVVGTRPGLFGDEDLTYGETPEGMAEIKARAEAGDDSGHAWQRYVRSCGGVPQAYANIQHLIRGAAMEKFADEYRKMIGRELKTAPQPIPYPERHGLGTLPKAKWQTVWDEIQAEAARKYAQVAPRAGGKFAKEEDEGGRKAKVEASERRGRRAQMTAFSELRVPVARATLGTRLEKQLVGPWSQVAPSFDPKGEYSTPLDVSMSGKRVSQQRAIKLIDRMKRVSLNLKTSGGKTLSGLGAFTHLHAQGKAKRAVFAVPAKQTQQWAMEATKFLEPGKYKHFAAGDADARERRAAYANPDTHMVFVGHEALRDDITWAVAQHAFGGDVKQAEEALAQGPPKRASADELRAWEQKRNAMVQGATKAQGWTWDFAMLDEGQKALNREGKANSRLANSLDGLTAALPYYVNATATAVKNDVSEAFDVAHKVRPDRFPLEDRDRWQRAYGTTGVDATGEAMRRELAPYCYAADAQTGNERVDHTRTVLTTPQQKKRYEEVDAAYQAARKANPGSPEQLAAVEKLLKPSELAALSPDEKQRRLARAASALDNNRDRALERIVYGGDEALLPDEIGVFQDVEHVARSYANKGLDGEQKPGVVFAYSPGAVRRLAQHLRSKGFRVGAITGSTAPDRADATINGFFPTAHLDRSNPEASERAMRAAAKYDILVCSDAVAQGVNMHRAGWHYDVDSPWTAMTVEQRHGRSDRINNLYGTLDYHQARHDTTVDQRRREKVAEKAPITGAFSKPYEALDQDGTGLVRDIIDERELGAQRGLLAALAPRAAQAAVTAR